MKKILIILLTVIMTMVLFMGCQPTPSEPVVINKGGDSLASAIAQTASPSSEYKLPETWKDTFQREGSKLAVDIDANISIPEVNAYPVVKISASKFTQEQVDKIVQVLFQGKKVFNSSRRFTKSELEDLLIQAKADLAKKQANPSSNESSVEDLQETINEIETEILSAPESVDDTTASTQLQLDNNDEIRLDLKADLGKKTDATLCLINKESKNPLTCFVQFVNTDNNGTYTSFEDYHLSDNTPIDLRISKDDAINLAEDKLKEIGITGMNVGDAVPGIIGGAEGSDVSHNPQCYMVYFTRTVNGIPTTFAERMGDEGNGPTIGQSNSSLPDYRPFWPREQILVCVDDSGIVEFIWKSPVNIIGSVSDNVALLPFEQIEKAFDEQMFVKYAAGIENGDDNMIEKRIYHIEYITLGLARVDSKDNLDEYMLVPVWDFFGSIQDEYDMNAVTTRMKELNPDNVDSNIKWYQDRNGVSVSNGSKSFVTINAVDGSLVN